MKKIKRTITLRKIEFVSNKTENRKTNSDVCPLCQSPIRVLTTEIDSSVENITAESSIELPNEEKGGVIEEKE